MRVAIALLGAGVALAACQPRRPPPQRVSLDCPSVQGELRRVSVAGDGRTCAYASAEGDQVSLRLVPVSAAGPAAALTPIEQSLTSESQSAASAPPTAAQPQGADRARNEALADAAGPGSAKPGDEDDSSGVDVQTGPNHVKVDLPGIHVAADGAGANVKVGGIAVDAQANGAVVRTARDVRLRGEAFSRLKRGYRASYVLAKADLPGGFTAVGYEAAGPKGGPLAVAVVHSRASDSDRLYHDIKALVRRNGDV